MEQASNASQSSTSRATDMLRRTAEAALGMIANIEALFATIDSGQSAATVETDHRQLHDMAGAIREVKLAIACHAAHVIEHDPAAATKFFALAHYIDVAFLAILVKIEETERRRELIQTRGEAMLPSDTLHQETPSSRADEQQEPTGVSSPEAVHCTQPQ